MRLSAETFLNQYFDSVSQSLNIDFLYNIVGESKKQQHSCLFFRDASCAKVEQCFVFNLTYRRSMRTFHVVGIDLQLWL